MASKILPTLHDRQSTVQITMVLLRPTYDSTPIVRGLVLHLILSFSAFACRPEDFIYAMDTSSSTMNPLSTTAREILQSDAGISDIEFALSFLPKAGIKASVVGSATNDRLVKVSRMILSLFKQQSVTDESLSDLSDEEIESSVQRLVQDFELITTGKLGHVPRVPFGKTGLEMPIVTLGCMRFQQAWGPRIQSLNQVGSDCQDNLVAILRQAITQYGMVHIETARAYGSSELQLGAALKQLIMAGEVQRKDLIIQSKVNASEDPNEFRKELETSMHLLGVDYLDLFSIHGLNLPEHMEWIFGKDGNNCINVVREFVKAGKIRHVGFSTHGPTDLILQAIETNEFEYVNIHYHAIGSYTASGYGATATGGNLEAIELLHSKNMGIFIISPYDKGGALYSPSRKLRNICAPEAEPMVYQSWWLWNHDKLNIGENAPKIHTFTVGAARPSDLDEPALAAYHLRTNAEKVLKDVKTIYERMKAAYDASVGEKWAKSWWKGLPKALTSQYQIEHNQMVWLYNSVKAYGLYSFAKARYGAFEGNAKKWDYSKSAEENFAIIGTRGWGYVPGLPLDSLQNYNTDLKDVPQENKAKVIEAESFCLKWLASSVAGRGVTAETGDSSKIPKVEIPAAWETAYDLRTWPDFPDQPARQ